MKVRLWDDDKGTAWRASVTDKDYQLLVISQFTLFGLLRKVSILNGNGILNATGRVTSPTTD